MMIERCEWCYGRRIGMNDDPDFDGLICMCPQMLIAELARLRADVEDLTADRDSWIEQASARTADAVQFMQERDAVRAEAEVLRADALKQVDCRQCKHATNRGCHSTALCERGELFEATPPWQFYDAARAAQGER